MALPDPGARRFMTPGRLAVLALFGVVLAAVLSSGVTELFSAEALRAHQARVQAFVAANPVAALAVYGAVYVLAVACSLPGAVWLTIAGGFAFGPIAGGIAAVFAATVGAVVVFLSARYVFADLFRAKAGAALARMEAGFRRDAFSYLLVLRLVPLFPFFIVNLVPAFLGVSATTFALGTLLGIAPGTFVFATVGAGIGDALAAGTAVDPGAVLRQPTVIGGLLGLALLALIPVAYRRFTGRSHGH
jgi:uncharacterized membrane protein YdjX (TVP38/TMEM64 family)